MGTHYAVMGVDATLAAVQQTVRYIRVPVTGTLEEIIFEAGAALPGDATFDVNVGATPGAVATIFPVAADRPKILSGQLRGTKVLSRAVSEGDILTVDLDAPPLGGVPAPMFITAKIRDTEGLRSTVTYVTEELDDGEAAHVNIPNMGRGWKLLSAETDVPAWVRIYNTDANRDADATRLIDEDPEGATHGVCAEFATSDDLPALDFFAPYPEGFNLDDAASTDAIASITNLSGAASAVSVTFTRIITEK